MIRYVYSVNETGLLLSELNFRLTDADVVNEAFNWNRVSDVTHLTTTLKVKPFRSHATTPPKEVSVYVKLQFRESDDEMAYVIEDRFVMVDRKLVLEGAPE